MDFRKKNFAILFATVAVCLLAVLGDENVLAHAVPAHSDPPIDGTVAEAPIQVVVQFSEEIVPNQTRIDVLSPAGASVASGTSEVDLNDPNRQRVSVQLETPLEPGRYIVQWTSESAIDGDVVSGSYSFTYDPAATPMAAGPQSTAISAPPIAPSDPASNDDNSIGSFTILLFAIVAIVILSIFGLILWRGHSRSQNEPSETDENLTTTSSEN